MATWIGAVVAAEIIISDEIWPTLEGCPLFKHKKVLLAHLDIAGPRQTLEMVAHAACWCRARADRRFNGDTFGDPSDYARYIYCHENKLADTFLALWREGMEVVG